MYCHLCDTMSPTHSSSSGHQAARELAAEALERLSNHVGGESIEGANVSDEKDSVKTPVAVSYCDVCNTVYPINEQTTHYRQKSHGLALLSEQEFEELVRAYVGDKQNLETSEASEDVAFVDETEAVKTYTCHLCALDIPLAFRPEHERGSRHRASRTFALAAARRVRNSLTPKTKYDESKGKSEEGSGDKTIDEKDKLEDQSKDKSAEQSREKSKDGLEDKPKFTSKMMKKLFKAYIGRDDVEIETKEPETSTEPDSTNQKPKLTPKQYFSDILPFLPYVGTLNTLYVDDTEFVTIQIGTETLKIHVNNMNGLYNFQHGNYMSCRLCDGFADTYYSSVGQTDKLHVMSLGHIRNVMSPVENVHLIRKIDEAHYFCGVCNDPISLFVNSVENHIFKDHRHTAALAKALERGKDFKETKDHLKIMIYTPSAPKSSIFKNQYNNKWVFGGQQPKQYGLFGANNAVGTFGANNATGTFGAQNTGFGTQSGAQSIGFGAHSTGFGTGTNSGSAQSSFGSTQGKGQFGGQNTFGNAQIATGFGAANKPSVFGAAQNNIGSGAVQNNTGFGAANKPSVFGAAQNNTGFGATQNTGFGTPQNNTGLGKAQNNTGFGAPQNNTSSGAPQITGFGAPQSASPFGAAHVKNTGFTIPLNNATVGATSNNVGAQNTTGFDAGPKYIGFTRSNKGSCVTNNTTNTLFQSSGAAQNNGIAHGHVIALVNADSFASHPEKARLCVEALFDPELNARLDPIQTNKHDPDKILVYQKIVKDAMDKQRLSKGDTPIQGNNQIQTKTDVQDGDNKGALAVLTPPRKLNDSSSSSDSD